MMPVCVVDSAKGEIARYEPKRGKRSQATHRAVVNMGGAYDFEGFMVEAFRLHPDSAFYVGPPIKPPDPWGFCA